jgi:hypothetical protein
MACEAKVDTTVCDWQNFCKKRGKCAIRGQFTLKATADCPMRDMVDASGTCKKC